MSLIVDLRECHIKLKVVMYLWQVDTVKRLLIKKLPPVLAIQLKRFDYDWERECAIKFNDYFEFPRELDMEPYTVAGVAKLEGSDVHPENQVLHQHALSLVFKLCLI